MIGVFAGATISTYLIFNLLADTELARSGDPLQLLIGNIGFLPPGVGEARLRRVLAVYRANARAARRYRPGSYPDGLVLLRAQETPHGEADLGWRRVVDGPVEIHTVPGNHLTLLAEAGGAAASSVGAASRSSMRTNPTVLIRAISSLHHPTRTSTSVPVAIPPY